MESFYWGYPGSIGSFFIFLRNDFIVHTFGVYIILVRNFFFYSFFFLLRGTKKCFVQVGGKVIGGGGEGGSGGGSSEKHFLSLLLLKLVFPPPRFTVISFHLPFTFLSSLVLGFLMFGIFSFLNCLGHPRWWGRAVYEGRTREY